MPGKYHHVNSKHNPNHLSAIRRSFPSNTASGHRKPPSCDDNYLTISDDDEYVSDDEMQEIAGEKETSSDKEQDSECEIADGDLEQCSSHDDSDIESDNNVEPQISKSKNTMSDVGKVDLSNFC